MSQKQLASWDVLVAKRMAQHFRHFHTAGPARSGGPRVQHPGDVGVIHQGQRLPLGLEPGDDLPGIHPRLDDLQGNPAADRLALFGDINNPHAAFADLLPKLVGADRGAGLLNRLSQARA